MAPFSYQKSGLVLRKGSTRMTKTQCRELQGHLRALGYLRRGIDGAFGSGTERAVKALQHDLLHNAGASSRSDGTASVRVLDYNRGRVTDVTGVVDQRMVGCIADMMGDPDLPKLPWADDPRARNRERVAELWALRSTDVPVPFLVAIFKQESRLRHFNEPRAGDDDTYIVVGLDTNASAKHVITSRGYGLGQYTLFHHPPSQAEVDDFMLDVGRNIQKAVRELRGKFDTFVNGPTSGTRADDRVAEVGTGPLRLCKFAESDPRYLSDCRQCALDAGAMQIRSGVTPTYAGSRSRFVPTQYYKKADYDGVPIRKQFECDWPYAARRYNGSGTNSYHYQVKILKNLLAPPP